MSVLFLYELFDFCRRDAVQSFVVCLIFKIAGSFRTLYFSSVLALQGFDTPLYALPIKVLPM
jgi:hypothetical protein